MKTPTRVNLEQCGASYRSSVLLFSPTRLESWIWIASLRWHNNLWQGSYCDSMTGFTMCKVTGEKPTQASFSQVHFNVVLLEEQGLNDRLMSNYLLILTALVYFIILGLQCLVSWPIITTLMIVLTCPGLQHTSSMSIRTKIVPHTLNTSYTIYTFSHRCHKACVCWIYWCFFQIVWKLSVWGPISLATLWAPSHSHTLSWSRS